MKYLNSAPFSSQPATENYRNNYPFRDKFAEALAAEKANEALCPACHHKAHPEGACTACRGGKGADNWSVLQCGSLK
jgi:hypothetical protein